MTTLTISPFQEVYHNVFQALVAAMPDTGFILKAPVIVPYSDMKPTTFIITANPGDPLDIYVNDKLVSHIIAAEARFQLNMQLAQGYSRIRVQSPMESFRLVVAATNYATLYAAWADQYFSEIGVNLQDISRNLNSRFNLKQVEHQILWQDLLPGTRMMRILAGKMAVKSLINMAPTDEGIEDLAKALTGTTPIVLPTLLDQDVYEPECRLLYATAQDFAGYEFNLWLFNLCAASWQAFVILMNNLDDDIYKLLSVSDQQVKLLHGRTTIESHTFELDAPRCSIVNILTQFLDCFARIKVFVAGSVLDEFSVCAYGYPFDLAVSNPVGYLRFDSGIVLDNNPQLPFDSTDPSDPYTDGLLGLPITCRFDSGNLLNSLDPQVVPGANCPVSDVVCGFLEPCASGSVQALLTLSVGAPMGYPVFLGGTQSGLPNLWVTNQTITLRRLAPLTRAVNATVTLGAASLGLATGAGFLWAAAGADVSRVDPETKTILTSYVLGGTVNRLVWDPVKGLLLSANSNGTVNTVDWVIALVAAPIVGLQPISGIRLIGRVLYLLSTSGNIVYAYNADTLALLWLKALPAATGPSDVIEANGYVWVACTNSTVLQLDVNHSVVSTTPAATGASRFAWVDTVQQWWVTGATDNRVWAFDPVAALPTASAVYTLPAGAFPQSSWVAGGQLFYTANVDGSVSVIDALAATVSTSAVAAPPLFDILGT